MARSNDSNLLELNIDSLFENHKIEEIIEIEKNIDTEIERKRVELRSMVGDRYKDVLAASDAIKNMKIISKSIVGNIEKITDVCETLISDYKLQNEMEHLKDRFNKCNSSNEMRILVGQVRLAIFLNEEIWTVLDKEDFLKAAQFYLLAQHVHTGLSLTRKDHLEKLSLLLDQIKCNLLTLKKQILHKVRQKLEMEEITAHETSSTLVALLLLNNHTTNELLTIFINHRKTALSAVMKRPHANVRLQVKAMVKCLITTVCLLHDCFIKSYGDVSNGLIQQQLAEFVSKSSLPTLSKTTLASTSLIISYIPDIIKEFKPGSQNVDVRLKGDDFSVLQDWLNLTKLDIKNGLEDSLEMITSIKGLHIIREEALKIELPQEWEKMCRECNLPLNFDVWFYFFQNLITHRAKKLVSDKAMLIVQGVYKNVEQVLQSSSHQQSNNSLDYVVREIWMEENLTDNVHIDNLTLKTMGFSKIIKKLCQKFDADNLELLEDISQYLYGTDFEETRFNYVRQQQSSKIGRKFKDRENLESHLGNEIMKNSIQLTTLLQDIIKSESNPELLVSKSLICARFLRAILKLCPHFRKCCIFNGATDDNFNKISNHFTKCSMGFWENWVNKCVQGTDSEAKRLFSNMNVCSMISIILKWDALDIQERTEEKIFQSQIKVPLKPSLILNNLLNKMNGDLCHILPQTLPKNIHGQFIEKNVEVILNHYGETSTNKELGQNLALQFLFDVKFLAAFCISRDNDRLVSTSQEIFDRLRGKIDPFDLDVFYSHLQNNVARAVLQCQVILGCLLPSSAQLANLGTASEKFMQQEKDPSIIAISVPSISFPLFCTYAHQIPSQKPVSSAIPPEITKMLPPTSTPKKTTLDTTTTIRSSAAALFGGLSTDWFS